MAKGRGKGRRCGESEGGPGLGKDCPFPGKGLPLPLTRIVLEQAVLLLCYEYGTAVAALREAEQGEAEPARRTGYGERESSWRDGPAPMGMVRSLLDSWEDGLWRHGFFG